MGQILEAQRVDEREKESLLHELHEGRQKEIDKIKERQILEREIRKRLDFRHCNEIALDYKAKLKAKEKAEDEAWKSMIMAEAEKEAKVEQVGQQRRRMKMLELKKEADRLLVIIHFLQTHFMLCLVLLCVQNDSSFSFYHFTYSILWFYYM